MSALALFLPFSSNIPMQLHINSLICFFFLNLFHPYFTQQAARRLTSWLLLKEIWATSTGEWVYGIHWWFLPFLSSLTVLSFKRKAGTCSRLPESNIGQCTQKVLRSWASRLACQPSSAPSTTTGRLWRDVPFAPRQVASQTAGWLSLSAVISICLKTSHLPKYSFEEA